MRVLSVATSIVALLALGGGCGVVIGLDKITPRLAADAGIVAEAGIDGGVTADASTDGGDVPVEAGVDGGTCTGCGCPQSCETRLSVDTHWVVPAGCTSVTVLAWGAGGGAGETNAMQGGAGGFAQGTIDATPGATLEVVVGHAGENAILGGAGGAPGGGQGGVGTHRGGGGGGLSGVFGPGDVSRGAAILVAGGGGGGAGQGSTDGLGLSGGGLTGEVGGSRAGQPGNNSSGGTAVGDGESGGDPFGGRGGDGTCGGGGGGAGILGGGGGPSDTGGACGGGGGGAGFASNSVRGAGLMTGNGGLPPNYDKPRCKGAGYSGADGAVILICN